MNNSITTVAELQEKVKSFLEQLVDEDAIDGVGEVSGEFYTLGAELHESAAYGFIEITAG